METIKLSKQADQTGIWASSYLKAFFFLGGRGEKLYITIKINNQNGYKLKHSLVRQQIWKGKWLLLPIPMSVAQLLMHWKLARIHTSPSGLKQLFPSYM